MNTLRNIFEKSQLHQDYLNSLGGDWYMPFNTEIFDDYKGCYKLSQDLWEMGKLEKRQLKNGRIQFRKLASKI